MNYYQNFINGKFVDGSGGRINVTNPGNNKIVGEHAVADKQDVNEAVQAAKNLHQEGMGKVQVNYVPMHTFFIRYLLQTEIF